MLNTKIKKLIKKSIDNKYQNVLYKNNDIKNIYLLKKQFIKKNFSSLHLVKEDKINIYFKINTEIFLKNLILKKKLDNNDRYKLKRIYQKFSVHLKLCKSYDKNLIVLEKAETSINTYIYLGFLVNKINEINKIQKLNFILKINEKVLIMLDKVKKKKLLSMIANNLRYEIQLIKSFL